MQMLHQWNSLQRARVCPVFTSPEASPSPSEATGQISKDCIRNLGEENLSSFWKYTLQPATNKHSSSFSVLPKQHTQYSTVPPLASPTKLPAELRLYSWCLGLVPRRKHIDKLSGAQQLLQAARLEKDPNALPLASKKNTFHSKNHCWESGLSENKALYMPEDDFRTRSEISYFFNPVYSLIYSWKGKWRGSAIPERMHPEISTTLNLCHATSSPHLSETGVPRQAVLRAAPKWVGTYGPSHPSQCGSCFPLPSSKKSACSSPGGAQAARTAPAVAQHLCLFLKCII